MSAGRLCQCQCQCQCSLVPPLPRKYGVRLTVPEVRISAAVVALMTMTLRYVTTHDSATATGHLRTTLEPREIMIMHEGKEIHRDRAGSHRGVGEKDYQVYILLRYPLNSMIPDYLFFPPLVRLYD
jgi:hypothetical protein